MLNYIIIFILSIFKNKYKSLQFYVKLFYTNLLHLNVTFSHQKDLIALIAIIMCRCV